MRIANYSMVTRYVVTPLAIVASIACTTQAFAQTELQTAAASLTNDIYSQEIMKYVKGLRVAITPFVHAPGSPATISQFALENLIQAEFVKKKQLWPVTQANRSKALNKLSLWKGSVGDEKLAQQFGKIAGSDYVLMGMIADFGGRTTINVRLLAVADGSVVAAAEAVLGTATMTKLEVAPTKLSDGTTIPTAAPVVGSRAVNPKDGATLVFVPAGEFLMGSGETDDEQPPHKVTLTGYWIYQTPVTVAQYRKFCRATGRSMPGTPAWGFQDDHPIVGVSWEDAMAYCKWAGVSLPTEAQWEKAARGTDGRPYPWGKDFDTTALWSSADSKQSSTAPVNRTANISESPYGATDMTGNIWQWCADIYAMNYYKTSPAQDPKGAETGESRVIRGGSWPYSNPGSFRVSNRDKEIPTAKYGNGGFRCVSTGQ